MAQIIWTEPALEGLNDIAEYIALTNQTAARQWVQKVFSALERLENHPQSGRIPPELENLPYREVVVNPCRIFYKHEKGEVFVLHVMRQERDLRKFLLEIQGSDP